MLRYVWWGGGTKPITLESFVLDKLLFPIHNAEEPFRIPCRDVSGLQPPIRGNYLSGRGLVVEVSLWINVRNGSLQTFTQTFITLGPRSQSSPAELSP